MIPNSAGAFSTYTDRHTSTIIYLPLCLNPSHLSHYDILTCSVCSFSQLVHSSITSVWVKINAFYFSSYNLSFFSVMRHFSFHQISPRYLIQIDGILYNISFVSHLFFMFFLLYLQDSHFLCLAHRHTNKHILQYM